MLAVSDSISFTHPTLDGLVALNQLGEYSACGVLTAVLLPTYRNGLGAI